LISVGKFFATRLVFLRASLSPYVSRFLSEFVFLRRHSGRGQFSTPACLIYGRFFFEPFGPVRLPPSLFFSMKLSRPGPFSVGNGFPRRRPGLQQEIRDPLRSSTDSMRFHLQSPWFFVSEASRWKGFSDERSSFPGALLVEGWVLLAFDPAMMSGLHPEKSFIFDSSLQSPPPKAFRNGLYHCLPAIRTASPVFSALEQLLQRLRLPREAALHSF